jgi:hypothetical protein
MRQRVLRRIIIIAAAVWLAVSVYLYIVLSTGAVSAHNTGGAVTITEIKEISCDEKLSINIRKPFIQGLSGIEFENELNSHIENQISVAKDSALKTADEYWNDLKKQGYNPRQCSFYADYEVKSAEGILSLKVTSVLYMGGTSMPLTEYYNADIKTSKLLCLGDLFRNDKYKDILYAIIKSDMEKEPDGYFIEDFKAVTEITKFFIHEGSLYIAFTKYEIAPGASGEPEFRIPTERIEDYLKDEYRGVIR